MTERLKLENDNALLEVLPQLGGSVAAFALKRGGERLPVFRRWSGEVENPRTVACIPMAPWFGRISGGGVTWDGTFYPIARNDPEDDYPLHGDAWQSPWEVSESDADHIVLRLRSQAIPPFDYEAVLVYALSGASLQIRLSLQNCAAGPVPYGLGLHPWFPRTPDVTLRSRATGTWLPQPPQLPEKVAPDPLPPAWNFSAARRLPAGFVDNSFSGWDGRARIEWPGQGYAVEIAADPAIRLSHLYAPAPDIPIFCFEQVTHLIDAFNLSGAPEDAGLRTLAPGEETFMWVRFEAISL